VADVAAPHRQPRLPGDAEDDGGDGEADDRVGHGQADGDDDRAGDDGQAHVGVGARVVAVRCQRRAAQHPPRAGAHLGREPVAEEAHGARGGEGEQVAGRARMDESADRLHAGDAGGDEDGGDDEQAREALGARRPQGEGNRQRDRGGGVAEVVDEVGEQGDAVGGNEDEGLGDRGRAEHAERERHRADALARALDARVDEPVRVGMRVGGVGRRRHGRSA
jgi:hypothetical protein